MSDPFAEFAVEEDPFAQFAVDDAPKADPAKANEILTNGITFSMSPEEAEQEKSILGEDGIEFATSKAFLDYKFGTNNPPEMVQAQNEYEYGEGTTPAQANAHNRKPVKIFEQAWGSTIEQQKFTNIPAYITAKLIFDPAKRKKVLDVAESFGISTAGEAMQLPTMMQEIGAFQDEIANELQQRFDLSDEAIATIKAIRPAPLTAVEYAGKAWQAVPAEKLQEYGAGLVEKAGQIQSEHMSGKELEQNIAEGNWEDIANDIGTAIAFEFPRLSVQMALGYYSGGASLGFMGVTSAARKRAEKTEEDSLTERVLAPIAVGATEVLTEKVLGTQRIIDRATAGKIKSGIVNRIKQIAIDVTSGFASEAGATFGENVVDRLSGEEQKLTQGVLMSGIVGMIMDTGVGLASPMTLGDANRMRKQMTDEEIDTAVEEGKLTEEQGEAVKAPDHEREKAVDDANKAVYERFEEESEAPEQEQADETPVIDETSPEEALSEQETVTAETAEPGEIIGISRAEGNAFNRMVGEQDLPEAEKKKQVESMQEAVDTGRIEEANDLADEILKKPRPLNDVEVASMLGAKVKIVNRIDDLIKARKEAVEAGNTELVAELSDRISIATQQGVKLTRAAARGGTETARALAALAMKMDRRSFDLVNVQNEAITAKGEDLTAEERAEFEQLTTQIKEAEERIAQLEAEFDAKLEAEAKKMAEEILATTLEQRTTVQRRKNAQKKRADGKALLKKMQWEVQDVTGVPFKVAKALKDIAVSHIMDGATTLDEVVKRVQKDVPDSRVTAKVIYDSLGGRVKKEAKKAKSDAEKYVTELKTQARLQGEIKDAMEGIFDPKREKKPSSAEVTALRKKLKELRESFYRTETEEARIQAIDDRINKIEDMVDRVYRPVKSVKTKSKAIKEAEARLKLKNKELRAQDRIALLEELLRSDVQQTTRKEDASETTERLEKFRIRIEALNEQLKKKRSEEAIDAQIDSLTREVEQFVRDVRPVRKDKSDYRADELKQLRAEKRRQDQIVELLESIRTRKVSEKTAKDVTEDRQGYEAMKKELREQMRKEAWYQDQKELQELGMVREEIADLERRLEEGDYEGFITPRQERIIKNQELLAEKIKRNKLRKEVTRKINDLRPKTWKDRAWEWYEIGRTAKLTADVGHIWRQGGYALSNPFRANAFRFTKESFAALFSEDAAEIMDLKVQESPYYDAGQVAGLHLIEEGQRPGEMEMVISSQLTRRTRKLGEKIDEKLEGIPVGKAVKAVAQLPGKVVEASERTQKSSINYLRQSLFDGFMERNPNTTPAEQKEVAEYINIVTGYGMGKTVDGASRVFEKLLTSTRFTASRYQTAGMPVVGMFKYKSKALRREILEDSLWFYGVRAGLMLLLGAAFKDKFDEIDIGLNPDHHTFGRILVKQENGTTRVYDPWAGVQRTARIMRKLQRGEGNILEIMLEDLQKSAHPTISGVYNIYTGRKYPSEEVPRGEAALRAVTPISIESAVDSIVEDTSGADMIFSTMLDIVGIGSYTMETRDLRGKTRFKDREKK